MLKKLTPVFLIAVSLLASSCTDYGKKVSKKHIEVYYKDGITETEANGTASLLYSIDSAYNNSRDTKSMQLVKTNDTVTYRMVVNQDRLADVGEGAFLAIGIMLSDSVFHHAPVNVDLTDNHFKTIKTIHYTLSAGETPSAQ